ncbi:NAD-dependent epimerase/dehydratase [Aurantimonas sp. MSK8Z-1]|uniref:NAD-dependent epimerase/dehydratase family protein n=1 Tax=Mangrovibrevibacter kandeliae TaxID=2968473 RepID=UPI002118A9F9|nr:NAD-dependent epimerase/dehydratase [Aurantimonas sp. MSK8Z-1]MCW4116993.1 NAD-dependent epimerase/dehydratase [Aurantimonas sp. MSK8Z-1]
MDGRAVILLTGASGFLGRHVLARLRAEGAAELHAVSRTPPPGGSDGVIWHAADLLAPGAPDALIDAVRPTHLLHNAWTAKPGRFWTDPENLAWLRATSELLASFARNVGRHFVGVGSCAEYDWTGAVFDEDTTPIRPATLYGKAKAAAGATALAYDAAGAFTAAWGRVFLPYGPGDTPGRLLPTVVATLRADREMSLGDGEVVRDFVLASDAADLLARLLVGGASGSYNIGSGQPTRIAEAVGYVAERLERSDLLRFNARSSPVAEPRRLVAEMGKIRSTLGWQAPTPLHAGLDRFLASTLA